MATEAPGGAGTHKSAGGGAAIMGAFVTALVMKLLLFDFMIAEGQSMSPVITAGDLLLVNKLAYGLRLPGQGRYLLRWAAPGEGDIVVFYTPLGEIAVKRCAGAAGGDFTAMGDNRDKSYDSRAYGPVPVDNIIGKVIGKE